MIDPDVSLGANVHIFDPSLVNIFGCEIGSETFIGPFVEIARGVCIGRKCLIESHTYICTGVTLEDEVFVGHGVIFVNDFYPRTDRRVVYPQTLIKKNASLGSNCTIIGGVTIGENAIVGAGAVVTKNVPALTIVAGNPAYEIKRFKRVEDLVSYINTKQKAK